MSDSARNSLICAGAAVALYGNELLRMKTHGAWVPSVRVYRPEDLTGYPIALVAHPERVPDPRSTSNPGRSTRGGADIERLV
jgi:hypothetical protein